MRHRTVAAGLPEARPTLGPYSRRLRRGALGTLYDGRSEQGRFVRMMEAQLVEHIGIPTVTQRLLIDRAVRLRLLIDAFEGKLTAGDFTSLDQRTYGGLSSQFRLVLRELGLKAAESDRVPSLSDYLASKPVEELAPGPKPVKRKRMKPAKASKSSTPPRRRHRGVPPPGDGTERVQDA
jgi:hypothetical protein